MGVKRFTIKIDPSPSGVYVPGETVSGVVSMYTSTENRFQGLYLTVVGNASLVFIVEGVRKKVRERYLNQTMYLVPPFPSDHTVQKPGYHRYPFSFTLPSQIPSSYAENDCKVVYALVAIMKYPWYKRDKVTIHPFTVRVIVNVDRNEMFSPMRNLVYKSSSGCNSFPSIKAETWLERTSYIPGETIYFCAKIANWSGKSIHKTTVRLMQHVTFTDGEKHTYTNERILWLRKEGKVRDKETQVWNNFPITVPPVPPSGMPFCKIIDIQYFIELIVDPGFFSFDLIVPLKIQIGSVPLLTLPFIKSQNKSKLLDVFACVTNQSQSCPPKYEDRISTINDIDDDSVSLRDDRNLDQLPTASQVKVETEDEYLVLTALACLFRLLQFECKYKATADAEYRASDNVYFRWGKWWLFYYFRRLR